MSTGNRQWFFSIALACGILPQLTMGQLYTEDFADGEDDFDNGFCQVQWCPGVDVTQGASCQSPAVLRVLGVNDDDILWVHFGNIGCTQATISFNYGQWQSNLPANLADSMLTFKTSTSDVRSCSTSGFSTGVMLHKTWPTLPTCFPASHSIPLTPSTRSVYWKFDKGPNHPAFLMVDDIVITMTGCACGPGDCVPQLTQNFGSSFQSGSVCSLFPQTFAECEGGGPFVSPGGACAATGDQAMIFGLGMPVP